MEARFVIVNADDFGLTSGINRGIIEAHEQGVVTSASLMVRPAAAENAANYARAHPRLSVGLHFDVAEWRYRQDEWEIAYRVVETGDASAIEAEFDRQLAAFRDLMGRDPTHLDSHQHAHRAEPARSILLERARRLDIPLRDCTPAIKYDGSFYGQTAEGRAYLDGISISHLKKLFAGVGTGWTELGCHPGYVNGLDSDYLSER